MQCGRLPKVPLTIPTGPTRISMPSCWAPCQSLGGRPRNRVWSKGVTVWVAPRPVLSGHRQLEFDALVVATDVLIADRPICSYAVESVRLEVAGMEPWRVAGVVDHGAADAAPGVVLAQLDRVVAAENALLRPVQGMRAGLVGNPVLVGMPERAGLQYHDAPARSRQPLREYRPAGAGPDDDRSTSSSSR